MLPGKPRVKDTPTGGARTLALLCVVLLVWWWVLPAPSEPSPPSKVHKDKDRAPLKLDPAPPKVEPKVEEPAPPKPKAKEEKKGCPSVAFTAEEVKAHTRCERAKDSFDLWLVIDNKVYDVSTWVKGHPGGSSTLCEGAGVDSTRLYHAVHGQHVDQYYLPQYCVGTIAAEEVAKLGP